MINKEMQKLRDGLDAAGIEWRDDSNGPWGMSTGIIRTKFTNKHGENCSVIFGENISYGWQGGFLETMPCVHPVEVEPDEWVDEVEGWLTAEEILEAWV